MLQSVFLDALEWTQDVELGCKLLSHAQLDFK